MEPEASLPHLQVPVTWPYPDSDSSSPSPTSHFLKIHLNIILLSRPGFSKRSFSLRFPHKNPVYTSPLFHSTTCSTPLLPSYFLYLITGIIFSEKIIYIKPQNSCKFKEFFGKRKLVQESGPRPRRDNKFLRHVTVPCMQLYSCRSKTKGKGKGVSRGENFETKTV